VRIAAQVFVAYALTLVLGAAWRFGVPSRFAPDVVALVAVYLGLTARGQVAPAVVGAVVLGYLADLLLGAPRGLLSLDAGALCLFAHVVHRRLLVRGWLFTTAFCAFIAALSGAIVLMLREYAGVGPSSAGDELAAVGATMLVTALLGPVVFRLCRRVDAHVAHTQGDRRTAGDGLIL